MGDNGSIRKVLSEKYLKGRGIEIGPGTCMTHVAKDVELLLFDKRSREDLAEYCNINITHIPDVKPLDSIPKYFPEGADFLISNHVLEHVSNTLNVLLWWCSFVKPHGFLMISVPEHSNTFDNKRLITSVDHIFIDYLLDRHDNSFESKEHIFSFLMSWIDTGCTENLNKFEVSDVAYRSIKSETNDIHWHVFTEETFKHVLLILSILSNRSINIKEIATPFNDWKTGNDILFIIQLDEECNYKNDLEYVRTKIQTIKNNILDKFEKIKGV